MDAVPVTLGQEFGGYAAQVRAGIARVRDALPRLGQIPLGGTATGTGLNTHPEFAAGCAAASPPNRLADLRAGRPLRGAGGAGRARRGLRRAQGRRGLAHEDRERPAAAWAQARAPGSREIFLPELQKGSSIMPGKVNPVIPEVVTQVAAQVIGNDTAITVGGMGGHFELNVYIPLMARNLLDSIELLASASRLLAEKCVDGIEANRERTSSTPRALSAATALNPYIGYDKGTEIVGGVPRPAVDSRGRA